MKNTRNQQIDRSLRQNAGNKDKLTSSHNSKHTEASKETIPPEFEPLDFQELFHNDELQKFERDTALYKLQTYLSERFESVLQPFWNKITKLDHQLIQQRSAHELLAVKTNHIVKVLYDEDLKEEDFMAEVKRALNLEKLQDEIIHHRQRRQSVRANESAEGSELDAQAEYNDGPRRQFSSQSQLDLLLLPQQEHHHRQEPQLQEATQAHEELRQQVNSMFSNDRKKTIVENNDDKVTQLRLRVMEERNMIMGTVHDLQSANRKVLVQNSEIQETFAYQKQMIDKFDQQLFELHKNLPKIEHALDAKIQQNYIDLKTVCNNCINRVSTNELSIMDLQTSSAGHKEMIQYLQSSFVDYQTSLKAATISIDHLKTGKVDQSYFGKHEHKTEELITDFSRKVSDLNSRLKMAENHVHLYLPYNQFCRTQNYLHVAFKDTDVIEKCREYEDFQFKQFMFDILADDSATVGIDRQGYLFGSMQTEDIPGVQTQKQRIRRVRDLLNDEFGQMTRDQKHALIDAAERRGGSFYNPEVLSKLSLVKEYEPFMKKIMQVQQAAQLQVAQANNLTDFIPKQATRKGESSYNSKEKTNTLSSVHKNMSRPSKEINLSELSQTGSQLQKLSESTPASSASSLNLSQLEQQEDFRKLSLDAEQYIGKKAVTQIEEDPEVRDYRTRFLRLKQRLFQPEIDEMTHEIERRFTEKQDAFFKSIQPVLRQVESRAKEVEAYSFQLESNVFKRIQNLHKDVEARFTLLQERQANAVESPAEPHFDKSPYQFISNSVEKLKSKRKEQNSTTLSNFTSSKDSVQPHYGVLSEKIANISTRQFSASNATSGQPRQPRLPKVVSGRELHSNLQKYKQEKKQNIYVQGKRNQQQNKTADDNIHTLFNNSQNFIQDGSSTEAFNEQVASQKGGMFISQSSVFTQPEHAVLL